MIFGFKKKRSADEDVDVEIEESEAEDIAEEDDEDVPAQSDRDDDTDGEDAATDEGPVDKWEELDASQDWREVGPFDINEVDLDADEVRRIDFGAIILTPFEGMKLQINPDPKTKGIQAVIASDGCSAIELAVFAAPAKSSIIADTRRDILVAAQKAGGQVRLAPGPFATEIRQIRPVQLPDGRERSVLTRTWLVQGPRWLLRGVVMGEAATASGADGVSELWYEFFANTVVRRDKQPRVPGDLIPLSLPRSTTENSPVAGEGSRTE